jgi:hypothetical protein
MESKATYTREDLLDAWLMHEASRASHPDIADYYYRQVWALCGAFKTDGPRLQLSRWPLERFQLGALFESSVRQYNKIHPPWGILLMGRYMPERIEVEARHAPWIDAAVAALCSALRDLMLELMERIWDVHAETTVTHKAVIENGFDPDTPDPDFDRYL